MTRSATAVAHPNIALIKYWGKRDEALFLPYTGSLSLTLDAFPTTTTVTVGDTESGTDSVVLDDELLLGPGVETTAGLKVARFLDLVRERAGQSERASVRSVNLVPTGAGLASSASGFAALAVSAAAAYGLELDARALSRLARRGSGSASRSIFGGFVQWNAGTDDESSYAEPIEAPAEALEVGMVVAIVAAGPKSIGSREAMRRTVATSPFYPPWVTETSRQLGEMRAAIARADFTAIGELAEGNALRMHATMLGAVPPVRYLSPASVELLDLVIALRAAGTECYATMDAGPNVKILARSGDLGAVADAVRAASPGAEVLTARSGPGASLVAGGHPADASS